MITLEIKNKDGNKINSDELFNDQELLDIIKRKMSDVFKNNKSIYNGFAITNKNKLYKYDIIDSENIKDLADDNFRTAFYCDCDSQFPIEEKPLHM